MTFIYNNLLIILATIPILLLVAAFIYIVIKLPKECYMAEPYRPPIPPHKWRRLKGG